jgi:hypothetical protein
MYAVCTCVVCAYALQIDREMRRTFCDGFGRHRPSHDQDRSVLGVVKALAARDPTGFGLDAASAQLEVALL